MLSSSVWRGSARWWFSAGLLLGGLTTALVAVTVGSLLLRPVLPKLAEVALMGTVFVLVASSEFGPLRLRLPQNARQVPQSIIDDGHRYGALHFGFEMGTGVRTYMTSGLPHALAAGLLLLPSLPEALLIGLAFGAGRALMTLARHAHPDRDTWDMALRKHDHLIRMTLTIASSVLITVVVINAGNLAA